MDAIVLDGEQRSALAVTRSLGRKGIKVIVGSGKKISLASCSRYCATSFQYPSPYDDPVGFINTLLEYVIKCRHSVLFPMTDVTLTEILLRRKEFPESTLIPFIEYDRYMEVTDKIRLFHLVRNLNVPVPPTFPSTEYDNHKSMMESIGNSEFPVVVKSNVSKIRTRNGWVNTKVLYAKDRTELSEILSQDIFREYPFLVQKKIEGPGVGIFLLMRDGDVIARFAHRRIREKPPSGGVSVLSESIEPPSDAMQSAIRILRELHWSGIAMVEFKIDREQQLAKLLEINARFWGSLQLAISSGIDFPYLLFRMASEEKIEKSDGYRVGLRSRWELGDLDHLLIRLMRNDTKLNLSQGHPGRSTLMKDFLFDYFRASVKNEIIQNDDRKPFYHELKEYIRHIVRK